MRSPTADTARRIRNGALPEGLEEAAAAPLMKVAAHDVDLARALWAVAHGLVDLKLAGRFPPDADIDAAWAAIVDHFR